VDYDNDGDLDMYVSNIGKNTFYQNNGEDLFSKITEGDFVNDQGSSLGSSWGDYDNDGFVDLFVANGQNQSNFLYRNLGAGIFEKIIDDDIVKDKQFTFGSSWGDFDNDGYLDLFVANWQNQNNSFYHNNGDGTFTKISSDIIVSDNGDSEGCSCADYDNDGDLDIFVANYGGQADFLYNNDGNENHWLNVKCVGKESNRSAIGTKVIIVTKFNSGVLRQTREIYGQTGYQSQNSLDLEFGLGTASKVDTMKIKWSSGVEEIYTDVPVDRRITIVEKNGFTSIKSVKQNLETGFILNQNYPNPFKHGTSFNFSLPYGVFVTLKIFNILGEEVDVLVSGYLPRGNHKIYRNFVDLANGVYLYKFQANDFVQIKKMMVIK